MITSEILGLLFNKYVLGAVAVLIGIIYSYFKGSSAAKKAAEDERLRAEAAQSARLRAAEAKNAFLEKKGELKNEEINAADTIDKLISVFDALQQQGKSGPSDKDSK